MKTKTFKSILEFQKNFNTDDKCRLFLEQQRWNGTPCCPFCASTIVFIKLPKIGYCQQSLLDEQKQEQIEAYRQKEIENIDASIRAANSVITTNENARNNKTAKYALYVAMCSVFISFVGVFIQYRNRAQPS